MSILDANGNEKASYSYNAWGKILSATGDMASVNPLRYRGYYYDDDTGFYYLNGRYYDPQIQRFINADELASTGQGIIGTNMFAYCGNNPVSRADSNGHFWEAIGIGFVAGVVGQYISDVIGNYRNGKSGVDMFRPTSSASDYLASGIGGAIAAIPGLNFAGTVAVGSVGNIVSDGLKGNIHSWGDLRRSGIRGGAANMFGLAVAKGMAALKVRQIGKMPRTSRKIFLRDEFYCNSQADVNVNLQTFKFSPLPVKIIIVESRFAVFKSGVYSTLTSTFSLLLPEV